MKNLILTFIISVFILAGCDDKDVTPNIYNNCGEAVFSDTSNFKVYLPNTYTPDGDKLNDLYRVYVVDSSQNIQSVSKVVIKNSAGEQVFSMDTMTVLGGKRVDWNFADKDGNVVLGSMHVSLTVTDLSGKQHLIEYNMCSYTCRSLKLHSVELDFTKCRFEDQIDFQRGFIYNSNQEEPEC